MSVEHKRSLYAFVTVAIVCGLIVVNAIRSEALMGHLRSETYRVVAGATISRDPAYGAVQVVSGASLETVSVAETALVARPAVATTPHHPAAHATVAVAAPAVPHAVTHTITHPAAPGQPAGHADVAGVRSHGGSAGAPGRGHRLGDVHGRGHRAEPTQGPTHRAGHRAHRAGQSHPLDARAHVVHVGHVAHVRHVVHVGHVRNAHAPHGVAHHQSILARPVRR